VFNTASGSAPKPAFFAASGRNSVPAGQAEIESSIMTVPAQADGPAAPQPNPYAPPRADVADVLQKSSATGKRSLLPLWLAAFYCIVGGAWHVVILVLAMYRAGEMLGWLLPVWAYAISFIQPAARLAAGISLIRRSRLSPVFFVALTAVAAIFPILWQRVWTSQTGAAHSAGPLSFLAIPDLLVLLAITGYAFSLKRRGMLK
jgi:hypothetical protein